MSRHSIDEQDLKGNKEKRKKLRKPNLSGDGGSGVDMIVGDDDVVRQNDDVVVNLVGDALGAGRRQIQPYGPTPPRCGEQD